MQWLRDHAPDLSWASQKRLVERSFDKEDDLLASIERSRTASQRAMAKTPEERQAIGQRAADTRRRRENHERIRQHLKSLRDNCQLWDAEHRPDTAIRATQPAALKRQARAKTNEARDGGELKPMSYWSRRYGKVVSVCERCKESGKVEAHHPDYSRPLQVAWLCIYCHAAIHLGELTDQAWAQTLGERAAMDRAGGRDLHSLAPALQLDLARRAVNQIAGRAATPIAVEQVTSLIGDALGRPRTPEEIYDHLRQQETDRRRV